ncbi:hypothetical protein EHS39_11640 [Ensifer sp. MPMI2T]|nr:hypothetical protein EHS39_11640 [Ensifer sp. MPMI2T]
MADLTEDDFAEIELAASRAMREWERGYVCQDIRLQNHISWWIMQETAKRVAATEYERGRRDVLDAITYTDGDGAIHNSKLEFVDLREFL